MCVLSSSYPLPTRTILSLSAMSSRHWIDRGAVDWLARPNAWNIAGGTVRISLCSHQKGICALLCAVAAHAVVCNAFFSFSQVLWEEKARETLRSFTSWDFSCPLRSGETFFIFSGITSFSDLRALCLVPCAAHGTIGIDHHSASNRKKRIPTPRVVLTVTWVQSYSSEPFARISALQTAYKKVIFLLSKNYKLIISMLCESL